MPTYRELLKSVKAEIAELDAADARSLEGATWIDVRRHDEWEQGHLPGATHVPRGERKKRMNDHIEELSLGQVARQKAFTLSGGFAAEITTH